MLYRKGMAGRMAALAFAVLLIANGAPAKADVKAGVDAWAQGDYAKAVREWRRMADAGDADAQFNLGQAYKLGRGVPMDLAAAMEWYRKAAVQGHARAEDNYGLLLFQQGQRQQAMPFLERSAERGEPRAQYLVGTALFNGDLLSRDWVRAYALMTRAASTGLPQAQSALAHMERYLPDAQRADGVALAEAMARQTSGAARAGADKSADAQAAPAAIPQMGSPPRVDAKPPSRIQTPPTPKVATEVRPVSRVSRADGGWRVQLGAFSTEKRAEAHWNMVSARVGGLSSLVRLMEKAGAVFRLQAGPLPSRAEAEKLCGAVKATGSDCIVKAM